MDFLMWLKAHEQWVYIASTVSFLALILVLAALMRSVRKHLPRLRLKAKRPLTENELEFFRRLQSALPEFDVLPQVAMSALMETTLPPNHPDFRAARTLFSQKVVDYVIYRRKPAGVVALIELDDRTHDAGKDAKRDEITRSVGLRTIRFHSRAKPNVEAIRRIVAGS